MTLQEVSDAFWTCYAAVECTFKTTRDRAAPDQQGLHVNRCICILHLEGIALTDPDHEG